VSLAAGWQMAHAQLQAFDAGQQRQHPEHHPLMSASQQALRASHGKGSRSAGQHGSGRSPMHHAPRSAPELEQERSTSSSQSSMEGEEPFDTEALDSGQRSRQRALPQQQDPGSSSKAKAGPKATLASPSKRPKAAVSQCETGVQTDDYISAAEVELVTEAQGLRQQLSNLAGEGRPAQTLLLGCAGAAHPQCLTAMSDCYMRQW
jgi:hypothetical protein